MTWRRAVLYIVLLNSTFFLKGCADHTMIVSTGLFFPCTVFSVSEVKLFMLPSRLREFSVPSLAVNLGLTAGFFIYLRRRSGRLQAHLSSRSFLLSLWALVILMSSFIITMAVWVNLVFWPTAWLSRGTEWLLFLGEPPPGGGPPDPRLSVSIAARLYFVALLALFSGLGRLRFRRRRPASAAH